jgi:DNA-binding CsgD family transcriptional regulator
LGRNESLTVREREVLKLVCEGCSTNEIAATLKIASQTAAYHRRSISNKARISNPVSLLGWAVEHGYLNVEPPGDPSALGAASKLPLS